MCYTSSLTFNCAWKAAVDSSAEHLLIEVGRPQQKREDYFFALKDVRAIYGLATEAPLEVCCQAEGTSGRRLTGESVVLRVEILIESVLLTIFSSTSGSVFIDRLTRSQWLQFLAPLAETRPRGPIQS